MSEVLSENNPYYCYKILDDASDFLKETNDENDYVVSYYVLEGEMSFDFNQKRDKIIENEVIIFSSVKNLKNISISKNSKIFEVTSMKKDKDILEIVDNNGLRTEKVVQNYKKTKNHKKVNKPWGYEIWYVWLKDYHVIKKIFMKKGNKCSLQYHDEKYETNYLITGKAKIIKGLHIDLNDDKKIIFEKILNKNLHKDFSIIKDAPYKFTNIPGEVHRVYSEEDYVAYEVSTPQLDDVIRVQDDSSRPSGLINSEHK